MKKRTKKLTLLSAALGLCLILSYLEAILPLALLLPGFKLGLSNLIILLLIKHFGLKSALLVNVARILLSTLLFGNILSLVFSLSGGICSAIIMRLLIKNPHLSLIGVSAAGGAMHNLAQIVAATLFLNTSGLLYLSPFLLLLGLVTGIICGFGAHFTNRRIKHLIRKSL